MTPPEMDGFVEASHIGASDPDNWRLVEFEGAHIEGAPNTPLKKLREHAVLLRERAAGKRVALACKTGRRAEEACRLLQSEGIEGLHVLRGGVVAWEQAGLPLRRGEQRMSLERQVRDAAGTLVVLGVVLGYLVHLAFFGLAGFVGAGLVFAGLTDTCGMAMMLAKMPWNRVPATYPED
jgi:rhodanese-related sulfurtransferase